MASRYLGYEVLRNLAESTNDRVALTNLGGGGIDADLSLFINNLNNTTKLTWRYDTNFSAIVDNKFIFPTTVPLVYTNGDVVTVSIPEDEPTQLNPSLGDLDPELIYYVVELNLRDGQRLTQVSFGLSTSPDGPLVSLNNIIGSVVLTRSDPVTKENILNISSATSSAFDFGLAETDLTYNFTDFNNAFDDIESNIDTFNYLRSFKYVNNQSTTINRKIAIEGSVEIYDPAEHNSSALNLNTETSTKSPGVYISDPFSDILDIKKTRAYSTDSSPWEDSISTPELITKSEQVNIGELYFSNGIKFNGITHLNTNNESPVAAAFTHKILVLIDGVEYSILLNYVPPTP
jgi:hypothetical protein